MLYIYKTLGAISKHDNMREIGLRCHEKTSKDKFYN